jgi:hypothetical protein
MSWLTKLATAAVQRQNLRLLKQVAELSGEKQILSLELDVVKYDAYKLKAELTAAKIRLEDLLAKQRRWLGHYDVCERAQAVADHDRDKAASNQ